MNYIEELSKKENIKKRILFAVIILVTFLLQTTDGFFPAPFGIHACILIPATVCIAMFEREFSGLFFGLASGMMLDSVSSDTVCYYSVFFTLMGFVTGMLITYLMRNNLVTALMFTSVFSLIHNSLYCLLYYLFDGADISFAFYLKYYFASAVYTALLTPIFYFLTRAIEKKYK